MRLLILLLLSGCVVANPEAAPGVDLAAAIGSVDAGGWVEGESSEGLGDAIPHNPHLRFTGRIDLGVPSDGSSPDAFAEPDGLVDSDAFAEPDGLVDSDAFAEPDGLVDSDASPAPDGLVEPDAIADPGQDSEPESDMGGSETTADAAVAPEDAQAIDEGVEGDSDQDAAPPVFPVSDPGDGPFWGDTLICHRMRDAYLLECGTSDVANLECQWMPGHHPADFARCIDTPRCAAFRWNAQCDVARGVPDYCAQYAELVDDECGGGQGHPCPFAGDRLPADWGACVISFRIAGGCLPTHDPAWHRAVCAPARD